MNLYLLQLVGKWIGIFLITVASFGTINIEEEEFTLKNDINKGENVISVVTPHEVEIRYNDALPSEKKTVIQEGVDGLAFLNEDGKEKVIVEMVPEIIEQGTAPASVYVGKITGYGPDCPGCSAVGNVACRTREGTNHSLNDSIYYEDTEYGKIHILAADRSLFPCGTILEVQKGEVKFIGIVLDTGAAMVNAWKNGQVLIDLAYDSQASALHNQIISGTNVNYKVKRWGW